MSTTSSGAPGDDPQLLEIARRGDELAYHRLVEPYRPELTGYCYRMLGSIHDADDAVQDALVRAWRGLPGFAGRSSVRTWLYTITTNVCRRAIERRSRRALPVDSGPAADPSDSQWRLIEAGFVEPYPGDGVQSGSANAAPAARYEQRESVELAFVAAIQYLPPAQRSTLILRDVLGFSARETAEILDTTVASVTSALQRARLSIESRVPDRSQQANLRALGDVGMQQVVHAYVDAWERGDIDAILSMLADDAKFSMPPYETWYDGREAIAAFLPLGPLTERWRLIPVTASAQIAFGCYSWDSERGRYVADSIDVLTLRGDVIEQITAFLSPEALTRFGLPPTQPMN